jgi:hypothetical protein
MLYNEELSKRPPHPRLLRHLAADDLHTRIILANNIPQTEIVRFNRAYTLWSNTATYSLLPADPCPVSRYLHLVDCGWDPHSLIRACRTLEAAYASLPVLPGKIACSSRGQSKVRTKSRGLRLGKTRGVSGRGGGICKTPIGKRDYLHRHYPELRSPGTEELLKLRRNRMQSASGRCRSWHLVRCWRGFLVLIDGG